MPVSLVRRPLAEVDVEDGDAVRRWITAQVRDEVVVRGGVHPRVVLLAKGASLTYDLPEFAAEHPDAHPGATYRVLSGHPDAERAIAVLDGVLEDGGQVAVVFEEIHTGAEVWWSVALLPYRVDPDTGIGIADPTWSTQLTREVSELLPFLREWAWPPRGAVAAEPGPVVDAQTDLLGASGHLPVGATLPAHPNDMAGLIHALVTNDLLIGQIVGTVVVRLAGHAWEVWVLGNDMPAPLDDMIRYFANQRAPRAEGVGFAQLTVRAAEGPSTPILQIGAESHGHQVRVWAPLTFPDGRGAPAKLGAFSPVQMRDVTVDTGWLGIPPSVTLELALPDDLPEA